MAAEIIQIDTQDFTSQVYEGQDTNLISTFDLNTSLSSSSYIEYFIYDNNRNIITSNYNFTDYTIQNDGQSAGNEGNISQITVDPEKSLVNNGFDQGEYITYFNFLNKKIGSDLQQLYIAEISSDRTELRLDSTTLSNLDIVEQTTQFIQERENSTYFLDFYLNFGDNQLAIANNIQLDNLDPNNPTILIKLYESLPEEFDINSTTWVVTTLEESVAYQVTFEDEPIIFVDFENISGPNFNIDLKDRVNNSTQNLSYTDLISTSLTSSIQQLNSLLEEKEIDINVDYTSFENYIHFSSAQTRLENFYSKIQLIEQYSSSIAVLNNTTNSSSSISSSAAVYESKINNIITNFDGYEYFLYYENSPYAWPKTNNQKPYELAKSNSVTVLTWIGSTNEYSPYFGGLLNSASLYDNNNKDNLLYTIPEYLRDDSDNQQYELFVQMVAQHYDNIWIYYKEVTQKYNADNRLEYGISKDIVADAIRDFGIKLYQNNFSNEDLYTAFLGLTPEGGLFPFPNITGSLPTPSGFEYIEYFISASNDYMPLDDVNKSLYKRIYHNLPYLLKSKGTLPGLRALITSYGIPDTILRINEYGGKDKVNTNDWDYWQNEFNYAFNTSGSNFISSSWELNPDWNAPNNVPATLMFRFKTDGLPTSSISYSQSLWDGNGGSALVLTYTGSAYTSGSYSGSIIDPYYQYATLTFYPNTSAITQTASIYLPFYDGGWWSVMIAKDLYTYTLYAQNKIYEGGDNGTVSGFKASSSLTYASSNWDNTTISYFPVSFSVLSSVGYDIASYDVNLYDATGSIIGSFPPFVGSYQEIRYYTVPISESVFIDYTMNPHSIEGNTLNSSPNELAFRASIGGEQYTASISIHPKVTGSWQITQSFTNDSNFFYDATPNFIPNTEYTFADQPVAGIRNTISDKIRIENNVMPEGDTLSPFMSLSQMANISQSYTPNINYLEVAFSPTNEINEDIVDQLGYFNIGEFIGDPRLRSSSAVTYPALDQLRNEYFQKYTKNYDLVDFIRLIKFFDNSLFKMIRDFVPARTSLAAGIVIKQHLLERNKYPQPQVSWQNLDISGTLKPTWNGYEPETVEHFEGQTGGVFDQFNSILNISQSWYETINTISGSVTILHDSQDEFYDGEFSGSNILISDGILNEAYPVSTNFSEYKQVYYYGTSSAENTIFQNNFLNNATSPQDGEILFFERFFGNSPSPSIGTVGSLLYLKIAKIDCNGANNNIPLSQIDKILIQTPISLLGDIVLEYNVTPFGEQPTYYTYKVDSISYGTGSFPYASSIYPNQIFDYTVSASNATTIAPTFIPITFNSYGNISGNALGYFNPTTGIHTLGNTPNTPLSITGSVSIGGVGGTGKFSLNLLRQGNTTTLSTINVSTGNSYSISASYYGLQGDQIYLNGSNTGGIITYFNGSLLITQSRAVSSSNCEQVILEPYLITPNFYNSDENALINNSDSLRDSSYYMDVDYTSGITTPVNFNFLISGSAARAKVQDSNYTTLRHIIPRYLGSRSTSQLLNKWTRGDIGTFGKLPTIENVSSFVAYAPSIVSWTPEREISSAVFVKYLIDQNGDVIIPNTSENSLSIIQQNFRSGDKVKISLPSQGSGEESIFRTVVRGGSRIEPILYNQSGSAPNPKWVNQIYLTDNFNPGIIIGNYQATLAPGSYVNNPFTTFSDFYTWKELKLPVAYSVGPDATISTVAPLTNRYVVNAELINDNISLTIFVKLKISDTGGAYWSENSSANQYNPTYDARVVRWRGGTATPIDSYSANFSGQPKLINQNYEPLDFSAVIPFDQLQLNDEIAIEVYVTPVLGGLGNSALYIESNSTITFNQSPIANSGIISSGLWVSASGTITTEIQSQLSSSANLLFTSASSLVQYYGNPSVFQENISGSGFNPVVLPWSIKYGDEFRFEGREDFVFAVKQSQIISGSSNSLLVIELDRPLPAKSGSLSPAYTGSIIDYDHFLIRRYVDDASQIIIEGFRPTGTDGPYIITPEYTTPSLNKNADTFITDLTERGLL